jgi:hypothetical protein
VHLSESISDIIYIPALPVCYGDYSHNIYFYDSDTKCYYIAFAKSPIKWVNHYNAFMDEGFYKNYGYSHMVFYKFNPSTFPFKWVQIPNSEYHGFYGGFQFYPSFVFITFFKSY